MAISAADVELRFDSEDLIGWEAVSFIASLMAHEAESGFAGLYHVTLLNETISVIDLRLEDFAVSLTNEIVSQSMLGGTKARKAQGVGCYGSI